MNDIQRNTFSFILYGSVISEFTFNKEVQPKNTRSPMLFTDFPMITLVRPEHPSNAPLPMLVTEFGIITLVRLELP